MLNIWPQDYSLFAENVEFQTVYGMTTCVMYIRTKPTNFRKSIGKCSAVFHQGNPASFRLLSKMDLTSIDSIVLAGLEELDADTSDAQVNHHIRLVRVTLSVAMNHHILQT